MHSIHPSESLFETTTIERLKALGYVRHKGKELRAAGDFEDESVVHRPTLRAFLKETYPELPAMALEQAVTKIANPDGVDLDQRNKNFHDFLTRGFELPYEAADGSTRYTHLYPINWEVPGANTFWVVDQLTIVGQSRRRPDLIVYVNGLPLVLFELKNPYDEQPTVQGAYRQIQHYQHHITQLFNFNALCVISDGSDTLHGVHSASTEWFAPWKSIDGVRVEDTKTGSMKTLIEGLFPKNRLLEYIRYFIVHESSGQGIIKKGAKYHQYFGVRKAAAETTRATSPEGDRRIGVIWHTQGSGKSLSMVFLAGMLRQRMDNPSLVVQVDRTDLDEQLYDSFVAAKDLVGAVHHAESVDDLRRLLQTEGGEIIFTTVEKFQLQGAETEHPVLSSRRNIIVIADEAHRTQYGFSGRVRTVEETGARYTAYGYAYYLRQALPNASFIGFTGTPIEEEDRDTVAVFGDLIHTYDLTQAQQDGAIVPIYYEARLIDLQLINKDIDKELEEITGGDDIEKEKAKWTAIEAAAGTEQRLEKLAADLLAHYDRRTEGLFGKGMIVCMSRRICVGLYEALIAQRPEWGHRDLDKGRIKVVMTGSISKDPPAWSEAGHITSKAQRDQLKARFRDPDDPLQLVIVCDMWLTGTDIPCLHTLYVDKPMHGHTLMQAIARVNRVFRDKPAGLIVDYIGISTQLKEATKQYTSKNFGSPSEKLDEEAWAQFTKALDALRATVPDDVDISGWKRLSKIDFEDLCSNLYGHYVETDERLDEFLTLEKRASSAFSLVNHLEQADPYRDEMAFYQLIRSQLRRLKRSTDEETKRAYDGAVRELIDRSIHAEEAVDLYEAAGIDKPDISILDEEFLQEFKSKEEENLRLKLLEKLMRDEITSRRNTNVAKARSLQEMLESTLERYRRGALTSAEVIQAMVELRKELMGDEKRQEELGLGPDELAFYQAIEGLEDEAYDMPFLCDLVREIVGEVKRKLEVDWTKPHRENVKASVRSAVKRVLRRRGIGAEHFQFILSRVMEQAEARYQDWPKAG